MPRTTKRTWWTIKRKKPDGNGEDGYGRGICILKKAEDISHFFWQERKNTYGNVDESAKGKLSI